MSFLKKLFGGKETKLKLDEDDIVEAGACPNCWGIQAYEDQFIQIEADRQRDIINHDRTAQKAFVQKFVEEHVTGIRLKKDGDQLVCPKCSGKYKYVSGKAS